jgi:hypothetical protein
MNKDPLRPLACSPYRKWQRRGKKYVHRARMVMVVPVRNLGHLDADVPGCCGEQMVQESLHL